VDFALRTLLGAGAANHRELDAIGFESAGQVCLVEIKPEASAAELQTATLQTAAHIRRFQLLDAAGGDFRSNLATLATQKRSVDLLRAALPALLAGGPLVPVIAAPDDSPSWAERWRTAISTVRERVPTLLADLRMWRLDRDTGAVVETEIA
jgi:hypothetical protein